MEGEDRGINLTHFAFRTLAAMRAQCVVSYKWSFEIMTLSCMVAEILCVCQVLSQAYSR